VQVTWPRPKLRVDSTARMNVVGAQPRWFIRDVARNRVYKAVDLYLGDEAEAIGAPVRYSCNIVLLMQVPRSYQMTYGVVAWGGTEPSVDDPPGTGRRPCRPDYGRRPG
jgi:hypothetical protein